MKIRLPLGDLVKGRFIERMNRFVILCEIDGEGESHGVEAHLADPGRLNEILLPDTTIWLRKTNNPKRKTKWSAILAEAANNTTVSLVSTLPNNLIKIALQNRAIPELAAWNFLRAEYPVGKHRFDFLLEQNNLQLLLEVKSVTLVENDVAYFPDAVTKRGKNHLETLASIAKSETNIKCAVMFVVQRSDAKYITTASHIDPDFANALVVAEQAGVSLFGRCCSLTTKQITLGHAVPVKANHL